MCVYRNEHLLKLSCLSSFLSRQSGLWLKEIERSTWSQQPPRAWRIRQERFVNWIYVLGLSNWYWSNIFQDHSLLSLDIPKRRYWSPKRPACWRVLILLGLYVWRKYFIARIGTIPAAAMSCSLENSKYMKCRLENSSSSFSKLPNPGVKRSLQIPYNSSSPYELSRTSFFYRNYATLQSLICQQTA